MACQSSDMSLNELTDENLSFLDMELEALQSIFINELEVKENEEYTTISIDLYPSTADKLDEQYVRMTLQFVLNEEYPERIPDIIIRNPRGLSDEELNSITEDLREIAESKKGSSMLFEMIDAAKEHLTVGNRPCGECAICLHGFSDNDVFTKTECYHYFHSHCLARYAKNFFENLSNSDEDVENKTKSEELLCPMCRVPIEFDEWSVDYPPPEESKENSFTLSEEMVELQKNMAALFQKQVKKGGIIDIEAEKNKYLLEISNVPSRTNNEEKPEQTQAAEDDSVTDSKIEQSEKIDSPACDRKDYANNRSRNFDHRGKNRNFYRPNESRSNNRYQRYGKQPFNRGNYNKYRYGKQNSENSYRNEPETRQDVETEDYSVNQNATESEDLINTSLDVVEPDDTPENTEYPSPNSRPKYNSNFSPRYKNRGYHHGRNNYNYDGSQRPDKSSYNERRGSHTSHRYSVQRAEESSSKFEKKFENDVATNDDSNYRSNYRSGSYKHDNGYYSKQRYSDNRNNSYHDFKGAYSGRDSHSNSYNSRSNRFTDSKDRDQYQERNYREKQTRDQYQEKNYREKQGRDQYQEKNYREKQVRDQYHERNYREKQARDQYQERNYREKQARDQYQERNDREKQARDQYQERNDREKQARDQYQERNDREKQTREHYEERNYREKQTRGQYQERNYREKQTREQYQERNYRERQTREPYQEKNYREKQTYRDVKYKNSDDTAYNKSRQGSKNYTENRSERHSDRSYVESSNDKSESLELNNQNQNGDNDILSTENDSSNLLPNSSQHEKSLNKKDLTESEEKSCNMVSAFNSSVSNNFPNAFSENSDITPRTVNPPPGFANPLKKVVYGLQGANPPPGFNRS